MAPKAAPAAKKGSKSKYSPKKAVAGKKGVAAGTVAIMLAGKFRGRHVVVLKTLASENKKKKDASTLVVTGPYKYNGVPLRRVNKRYIIATSTKVDLSGVDAKLLEKVDKKTFKRANRVKGSKKSFLAAKAKGAAAGKKKIPDERVALQKQVDASVIAAVKKSPNGKLLPGYLKSVFTVKPGDTPHRMNF
jgi:large subunit ribosomal protein L6e